MSREKGQLTFNHLIQATMLDLIDRGNLRLTRDENGETLTCLHYEGLADFELKFIEMIFDQESAINISEVFSKYKIDKVAEHFSSLKNQIHIMRPYSKGRK